MPAFLLLLMLLLVSTLSQPVRSCVLTLRTINTAVTTVNSRTGAKRAPLLRNDGGTVEDVTGDFSSIRSVKA